MPRRRRKSAAVKAVELSIAVPQVIAHRTARMLSAGANPSVRDQLEFQRMSTEKVFAFWESVGAMTMAAWLTPFSAAKILAKGMDPIHRRATANARRLRRTKRR
jgi:hypothetical protein